MKPDPNFTEGLPAEIHLDYTREGMLGERAHKHHVEAVADAKKLRAALAYCVLWMDPREKMGSDVERVTDRAVRVLTETDRGY